MTIKNIAEKNIKDFVWPEFVTNEKVKKMIVFDNCYACPFSEYIISTWRCKLDAFHMDLNQPNVCDTIHPNCQLKDYPTGGNL